MGGINGMAKYQHHFGLSSAGVGTLIVFGLYTVNLLYPDRRFNKLCVYSGSVCGTTPAAYLPDRFGRRFFSGNASVASFRVTSLQYL